MTVSPRSPSSLVDLSRLIRDAQRAIADAKRFSYSHGPMHARRRDRHYARLAYAGAMVGFLACWLFVAAACWAAGGVQ